MDWDDQVNEVYGALSTDDLEQELRDTRGLISRDFAAADMFKDIGQEKRASVRRESALAFTRRAKRISTLLENRKGN